MVFLIGIAGPSCSGKSSICSRLAQEYGYEVISHDEFYVEHDDYPMLHGYRNMDCPQALKNEEFFEALKKIKSGQPAEIPVYDKVHSRRTGTRMAFPTSIVLVEGFLLFHDERINKMLDKKIYLDVSVEEQLRRRTERNVHADPDYFHKIILPMHLQYGAPTKVHADHIIDTNKPLESCIDETRAIFVKLIALLEEII